MSGKPGRKTPQQKAFLHYSEKGCLPVEAARLAGYKAPHSAAYDLMKKPEIVDETARRQMKRLRNELLPLAVELLRKVMVDDKETTRNRLTAAKIVVDKTLGDDDGTAGKEPHEMTAAELQARIEQLEDRRNAIAESAQDVTPDGGDEGDAIQDAELIEDAPESSVFG